MARTAPALSCGSLCMLCWSCVRSRADTAAAGSIAFRYDIHWTQGISLQCGKHGSLVKIVTQLPCRDGLRPVRSQVGIPSTALLDDHALLQQQGRKLVKAACLVKGFSDDLAQLLLVGFKLRVYLKTALRCAKC